MTVSEHYCGNILVSLSLMGNDEEHSCCDMEDCCHSESHVYQVKEDFSVAPFSTAPVIAELDLLGYHLFSKIGITDKETTVVNPYFKAPPLLPIQKSLSVKGVYLL